MDCNSRLCKIYTADSGYLQSILKILFVHDITQIGKLVAASKLSSYWQTINRPLTIIMILHKLLELLLEDLKSVTISDDKRSKRLIRPKDSSTQV